MTRAPHARAPWPPAAELLISATAAEQSDSDAAQPAQSTAAEPAQSTAAEPAHSSGPDTFLASRQVLTAVRRAKSAARLALHAPVPAVTVRGPETLLHQAARAEADLRAATAAQTLNFEPLADPDAALCATVAS